MSTANPARRGQLGLRASEWAVVRSKEEILATLDEHARLDDLPFQPEMFAFCGERLRVAKVAHKTCDNIRKTGGRRMVDAVHLDGARCDGSAHGSCQADCVFFWKEAWLDRVNGPARNSIVSDANVRCSEEQVNERVRAQGDETSENPTWVCQTTALYEATTLLKWWDVRQYIRDVTSGNHGAWHMTKLLLFAAYRKLVGLDVGYRILVGFFNWFQRLRGGKPYPEGRGRIPDGQATPTQLLDLTPGEWVEVRSQDEILATITESGFNRGMRYDMEMSKYCGERFRVQMKVDRLINEQTGKMMQMKNPCIQLEDVYCRAECTDRRLGCPRASNTYWRENWLRRVDNEASSQSKIS
ncbi:MAG: hypothetical protein IPH26_07450 [Sterolibacteriaceae bacterium]|uniref:Uncharacterized protein n=1 Tax=Candidatus Methylophosphatis roskildensis TaxID=2899263 RepID=A0A9D7E4J4_9PROT|nr:hypothetical protein [Candidatus Methylophosphatis roskildensis]MBK7235695.1 hypothetical protein [Sterolibacteriaceae bacterium]